MNMHEKSLKKLLGIYNTTTFCQFSSYDTGVSQKELEYMAAKGWISLLPREPDGYSITIEDKALIHFDDIKEQRIRFIKNSVLIPIVVTLLTDIAIFLIKWLWQLIQQ